MALSQVRLGLIGAGQWGRAYIRTIDQIPPVRLSWLCSSNPENRNLVPKHCQITEDWHSLVGSKDLDGVIIATPPALHAQMLLASLQAGLPAMVEKPMTVKLEEAIEIRDVALSTGVPVLVDHTHLFQPAYRRLKDMARELGPVKAVRSIGGQWVRARHGVSPLWDFGPHDVALSIDLMQTAPKAAKVTERQETSVEGGPGEIVSLDLEFLDGVVSSITVGNAIPEKRRLFAAQFDEETLLVDDLAEMKLTRYSGLRVHDLDHRSPEQLLKKHPAVHIPTEDTLPLTQAVEEFAQGIRDPLHLPSSFGVEPALAVTRVLTACENDKEYR